MEKSFAKTIGLNGNELKAYLSLVKHDQLPSCEVAKDSGVPQAKVYSTLRSLANKGFAVLVNEKPVTFKAIEPKGAIRGVLESKKNELDKAAKAALNFFKDQPLVVPLEKVKGNIELNVGIEQRMEKSLQLHLAAKKYFYMISPVEFKIPINNLKARIESLKRGVDERFIVSRINEQNRQEIKKYCRLMEMRHLEDPDYENLSIYVWDDKKFIIVVIDPADRSKTITVTIDSANLAKAMKKYYLGLYKKAKPVDPARL